MGNVIVSHEEQYEIFEKLKLGLNNSSDHRLPRGWVQVFLDNNKIHEGPNLIVAKGREFVAQKIFGLNTIETGPARPQFYNYKISHFAVGSGGASIEGDDVVLAGPKIGDTGLYQPIALMSPTSSGYADEPSRRENSAENPLIHSYRRAVKPISASGGSIILEPVSYQDSPDYYSKVRCTCIVPPGEPSQSNPGQSVQISEAGLYITPSDGVTVITTNVHMFAHICFSPKWIEKEAAITIFWYILC